MLRDVRVASTRFLGLSAFNAGPAGQCGSAAGSEVNCPFAGVMRSSGAVPLRQTHKGRRLGEPVSTLCPKLFCEIDQALPRRPTPPLWHKIRETTLPGSRKLPQMSRIRSNVSNQKQDRRDC